MYVLSQRKCVSWGDQGHFFENILASQNCVFGRAGLCFNPQNKQDKFSKNFSKLLVKQPTVKSKQSVVTCFYSMKRDHSVKFCKIRKYYVPSGFMKWIPKGCEVSNDKNKPNGPIFVRGQNLVAWIHAYVGNLEKKWGFESSDQILGRKILTLELNQCYVPVQVFSKVKRSFLITKQKTHWRDFIKG